MRRREGEEVYKYYIMLCWVLLITGICALAYFVNWMLEPYKNYRRVRRNFSPERVRIFKGRTTIQGSSESMPLLKDEPTFDITMVYPCYNEEDRFPRAMDETLAVRGDKRDSTSSRESGARTQFSSY